MSLVAVALAAQLYLACRDLRIAHRPAFLGVALVCVTHPVLTYTTQIYPELLAALGFVTAARLLRAGRGSTPLALAGASLCIGVLPWLSTRAALIAVGVALVIAYCAVRPLPSPTLPSARAFRVAAAALPFLALLAALSFVNWRLFGRFMPGAGYYLVSDQQPILTFAPHVGTLGLLFDRTFGLIPRAPIYLVAALGALALWRRTSTSLAALFLGWLAAFVYVASLAFWWADGGPPSRYLVAGLPFLAVLLAAGLERLEGLPGAAWRAVTLGLASFSVFIAYVYAVLPNIRYDIAVEIRLTERDGQLFEFVGKLLRPDPALAFPSIVRAAPLDLALGAVWLALLAVLVAKGKRHPGAGASSREGT